MAMNFTSTMVLDITGLGIVMHSPSTAAHIKEGENCLRAHYMDGTQVERHIQAGVIVGFNTGSSGLYIIEFFTGYPDAATLDAHERKLRLAVEVADQMLYIRDLYDLIDWTPDVPENQIVELENGIYHITLCSNQPPSGVLSYNQTILVYMQPLTSMPTLAKLRIPTLCA